MQSTRSHVLRCVPAAVALVSTGGRRTLVGRPAFAAILTGTLIACGVGCDRNHDAPTHTTTRPASTTTRRADAPVPTRVTMSTLATLSSNEIVPLAATGDGTTYAISSADGVVRRVDRAAGDAPELRPAAIIAALGVPGASGQITAIAARDDGKLAFAFVGDAVRPTTAPGETTSGSVPLAAIGTFDPAKGEIFASVDQATLAPVDAAFAEADAQRPTLIVHGDDAWLWRARADGQLRLLTIRGLSAIRPTLSSRDVSVGLGTSDAIERRAWEWSPTDEAGQFLLTDTASRWIRRLAENGQTAHVARFEDPAVASISPATLDAAGRVMTLARQRDGAVRSLLVQDGATFAEIAAARFTLDGKPLDVALRIDRLVPIIGSSDAFVAHDAASGRVVRLAVE